MSEYHIQHIVRGVANIEEPIIIYEKTTTRRIFIAQINDTKVEQGETVSGTILHQRKGPKEEWEDIQSIDLTKLKAGEGVKIKFHSDEIKKLYDGLTNLYKISGKGVPRRNGKFSFISDAEEILKVPKDRKELIQKLLGLNYCSEIWDELIEIYPDLATKLSFSRIQSNRQKSLKEFELMLFNDPSESEWQFFFEKNQWIFGYGLNYQFLDSIQSQPNYGGTSYTKKGAQKGDFLHKTQATAKFTVLVEIKKSNTYLIEKDKNGHHKKYRNGSWLLSNELIGGITQLQVNCKTWQRTSDYPDNVDLIKNKIYTINPKGILVIGNTKEFNEDRSKLESFEIYRQSLSNPEIITFDELYERAKFIVNQPESQNQIVTEITDDDVPF